MLGHELETTDQHSFGREYDRTGFDVGHWIRNHIWAFKLGLEITFIL